MIGGSYYIATKNNHGNWDIIVENQGLQNLFMESLNGKPLILVANKFMLFRSSDKKIGCITLNEQNE